MKRKFPSLIPLMVLFLSLGCQSGEGDVSGKGGTPIRIGYMICNSLQESMARFDPLTAYLSEKVGRRFESTYVNTYEFEDLVRKKEVDFA
ncbi:MAG: hypothetical protein SWE60_26665, partial [Thermodesulfobacteriota bacterium]|nr:hypothetical protein [Thermodesulfobacteriota bacterium]